MLKLLLIEDDDLLRGQLASGLSDAGYQVTEAGNGEEGLRLFDSISPDLVITDIVMDEGEGIAVIIALRRARPELPIIAMSGNPLYLEHGLKLGATEAFPKPFTMSKLLDGIARLTGQAPVKSMIG